VKKIAGFLVLGVFWLAGCPAPKPAPVNPALYITAGNMFLKGVMQGRLNETYAQWVSPGVKLSRSFSLEQFTADWQAIEGKYGVLRKARLTAYQIVPGRKVVQLYYQVTQGKAASVEYHLVAEAGPGGRCTIFFIDIGNAQPYPAAGNPGEKVALPQPLDVAP
jgi:hypothetical protein